MGLVRGTGFEFGSKLEVRPYSKENPQHWRPMFRELLVCPVFSILVLLCLLVVGCGCGADTPNRTNTGRVIPNSEPEGPTLRLTDDEWRQRLTPEEYRVLREHGTERAHTGDLLHNRETGTYTCAACEAPLFSSATKFNSGTGWPSFYQPLEGGRVGESRDVTFGMVRTEVHCSRCGGHLGHVFNDGPQPTGLRYCINSVSLNFQSDGEPSENESP